MGRGTYIRGFVSVLAGLAVLGFCVGGAARAETALPEGLDVPGLALAPADFDGGARIAAQGFVTPRAPQVAAYERIFHPGARLAGKRLLFAESMVSVYADDQTAAAVIQGVRALLSTSSGRRALIKAALAGAGGGRGRLSLTAARPVTLRLGQDAFRISLTGRIRTSLGSIRIDMALAAVRTDRAIGIVTLTGVPSTRLTGGPPVAAATKLARHLELGFTIRSLALPNVTGTAQQGQALTADPGHWAGAPSLFSYQWNRCDAAGANCAAIPGATAQTYVLGAQDSTKRIAVTVKAANSVSSAAATSGATPPVP